MRSNGGPDARVGSSVLALLAALVCSEAVHPAAPGRVSSLEGAAVLRETGGARDLALNEPLTSGVTLETDSGALLEIEIVGGTFIRIGGGSAIRLDRLGLDAEVTLLSGALASDPGPRARASVLGSRGERLLEGRGVVESGARGNQTDFLGWSDRRSRDAAGTLRDALVGEWELERHGEWRVVEGRRAWRPRVDASWRPYRDGEWRDLSWGWTWLPDEAWGFVTVHQGQWLRHRTLGWLWFRGDAWSPAWVTWDSRAGETLAWAPCSPAHVVFRPDPAIWIHVGLFRFGPCHSCAGGRPAPVRVYRSGTRESPQGGGGHRDDTGRGARGNNDGGGTGHHDDSRDNGRGDDDDSGGGRGDDDDYDDDDGGGDPGGGDAGGGDDDGEHDDNGHGNDDDHDDDSNPGQGEGGHGRGDDGKDDGGSQGGGRDSGNGNGHDDNGHGNDDDHDDDSNPGQGGGGHGGGGAGAGVLANRTRSEDWTARAAAPTREGWAPLSNRAAPRGRDGWSAVSPRASAGADRAPLGYRRASGTTVNTAPRTQPSPARSQFAALRTQSRPARSQFATPRASQAPARSSVAAPHAQPGPARSQFAAPRTPAPARSQVAAPRSSRAPARSQGGQPATSRASSKPSSTRGRR